MAAKKGNQYWRLRSKHGRNKIHTPETLLSSAYEYFEVVKENPFEVDKILGNGDHINQKVQRPFTLGSFVVYANITTETFSNYRELKDFFGVTKEIDQIIYNNKFEGASAGLFKENIIARDLGLADKKELEVKARLDTIEDIQNELDGIGLSE